MRFSVKYSPDEDNTTAADELGVLSSMRQLGGDAGSASPDGRRPWLPVELQPAAGRAETARARVGVWRAAPPTAAVLGFSPAVLQPARGSAQPALHWEQLKLSSANIVLLVAGYTGTRIHMQQTVLHITEGSDRVH